MQKRLYGLDEVLEMLPLSRSELYRRMAAGELAFIQMGTRRLFEVEAIEAFVTHLKQTSVVEELLELVDEQGRIDVVTIPEQATLADLAELKRLVAERAAVA